MKALVVGGTGSVGQEIVKNLERQSIRSYYTSRRAENISNTTTGILWDAPGRFVPPKELLSEDRPLLVFYCVGSPSSKLPVRETEIEEFSRLYDTNCLGLVQVYQALKKSGQKELSVVAISSDATVSARSNNGPYSASKSALEVISRTIACEDGQAGTRINILAPSLIDSPMARQINRSIGRADFDDVVRDLPYGRAISPAEVARAAVDIAMADQWSYANGQVFRMSAPPR